MKSSKLTSLSLGAGGPEVNIDGSADEVKILQLCWGSFKSLRSFEMSCVESVSAVASELIIKSLSLHECLKRLNISFMLQNNENSYEALAELLETCSRLSHLRFMSGGQ